MVEEEGQVEGKLAYSIFYDSNKILHSIMVSQVKVHLDFKAMINNDPIELLKHIQTLMHDPVWARYPFGSLTDSLVRILYLKATENE